jgi:hypothetical protein
LSGRANPIASSPRRSAFCASGSSIAAGVPSRAESSGIRRSASGTKVGDGRENALDTNRASGGAGSQGSVGCTSTRYPDTCCMAPVRASCSNNNDETPVLVASRR